MVGIGLFFPGPPFRTPKVSTPVSIVFDESGEFLLRYWCSSHRERLDLDRVCPLFVVEDEGQIAARPELEATARSVDVTEDSSGSVDGVALGEIAERWVAIRMCLPSVGERLGMHALMENTQEDEIRALGPRFLLIESFGHSLPNLLDVVESGLPIGQPEIPADGVIDGGGVVKGVAVLEKGLVFAPVTKDPSFLKPTTWPTSQRGGLTMARRGPSNSFSLRSETRSSVQTRISETS